MYIVVQRNANLSKCMTTTHTALCLKLELHLYITFQYLNSLALSSPPWSGIGSTMLYPFFFCFSCDSDIPKACVWKMGRDQVRNFLKSANVVQAWYIGDGGNYTSAPPEIRLESTNTAESCREEGIRKSRSDISSIDE